MVASFIEAAMVRERATLDALYKMLNVGVEERDFSNAKLMEVGELNSLSNTRKSVAAFIELGIVQRIMEYGTPANGMNPGRHFHMTLLLPYEEAVAKWEAYNAKVRADIEANRKAADEKSSLARRGKKIKQTTPKVNGTAEPEGLAIAKKTGDTQPVAAITGPTSDTFRTVLKSAMRDSEYTIDESNALVEAGRQYAERTHKMREKLSELGRAAQEMGIEFDLDKMLGAMSFRPDERLETVALTLPYIRRLEANIERQADQIVEMRRKVAGFDELRRENEGLRRQNGRLIAEKVGVQNRQTQA